MIDYPEAQRGTNKQTVRIHLMQTNEYAVIGPLSGQYHSVLTWVRGTRHDTGRSRNQLPRPAAFSLGQQVEGLACYILLLPIC